MNELKLRRLLNQIVRFTAPVPLLATWVGCGGATSNDDETPENQGGSTQIAGGGSGATAAAAGSGGRPLTTGGAGAGTGTGATAGTGTGANGGSGGGAGTGANGGSGGGAGTGANGGTGGNECRLTTPPLQCYREWTVTVPLACLPLELTTQTCWTICTERSFGCSLVQENSDSATVLCLPACVEGRRPAGFTESTSNGCGLAGHFSRAAELEAVSIVAFRELRRHLRAHGAPRSLLTKLSRAARDEQRHTRATRALARRFGARAQAPHVVRRETPALEQLALENAVEGCVREAYGALVATWQARRAKDPQVRATMLRIAREEIGHAALSFELARWFERRLGREPTLRIEAAKSQAIRELRAAIEVPHDAAVSVTAGLPSVPQSRELFEQLTQTLWS